MKAPSLVARLMGLEMMPAGSGSKPQKASASETWSNVADKLGARPGGSDKEDMDFEMAEIKSLEPGLQRFRAKCALTYPTRYFSPFEDEVYLVGNSLDHHSTDSYLSSSPNSSSKDKVFAESVDSVNDEPLFPEPDRDLSDCKTLLSTRWSCRELIHNVSRVLSKIGQLKGSKLRTCTKLPSSITKDILIANIIDEVEEWTQFVGLIPDELIEWDMSHYLGHKLIMGRSQLIYTGGSLMVTVKYSTDYKDDMNEALHTQYIFCTDVPNRGPVFHAAGTGTSAHTPQKEESGYPAVFGELQFASRLSVSYPDTFGIVLKLSSTRNLVLCIDDCDLFGSVATMNMCSKCKKEMILLKKEHAKLADASSKDIVHRSSSNDESKLALAEKHNFPFDYRNAGQNAIPKANPITVAEKLNKI
ncbi:Zinc finger A20 and AN1 domain-containing stress-associated protein 8 [Capsicum baccatum]|uniref:Zinc finger A20 and AN1 domain-containing stress-associated protein 8 n=1 Tax=Capsicum baccatum TaxID=33114 RepID=A0A2G2VCG7_CAPBA|nr:Zinc finger A20 and AN1 domain-containing stress-associated protein 8 [Capsicum baccatum]